MLIQSLMMIPPTNLLEAPESKHRMGRGALDPLGLVPSRVLQEGAQDLAASLRSKRVCVSDSSSVISRIRRYQWLGDQG